MLSEGLLVGIDDTISVKKEVPPAMAVDIGRWDNALLLEVVQMFDQISEQRGGEFPLQIVFYHNGLRYGQKLVIAEFLKRFPETFIAEG